MINPKRKRRGGLTHYLGGCDQCDAKFNSRNALGLAAKHTDKTGHETWVELGYSHKFFIDGAKD